MPRRLTEQEVRELHARAEGRSRRFLADHEARMNKVDEALKEAQPKTTEGQRHRWPVVIHRCPVCGWFEGAEDDRVRKGCEGFADDPHRLIPFVGADAIEVVPAEDFQRDLVHRSKLTEAERERDRWKRTAQGLEREWSAAEKREAEALVALNDPVPTDAVIRARAALLSWPSLPNPKEEG